MKVFTKILPLLLAISVLLSFSSCAKLEEFFASEEEEVKEGEKIPSISESYPRKPGVYNFLLVRESALPGTAASFTVCEMDVSVPSMSFFQIPANLFINDSKATSLKELYDVSYDSAAVSGLSDSESAMKGAKAVSAFVSDNMCIPIDYHIIVSRSTLTQYIDLIGEVEINLPFTFTTSAGITYQKGPRKIPGNVAFEFVEYNFFRYK